MNIEYPLRKVRNPGALDSIRQGNIRKPIREQSSCPRTLVRYLGNKAVMSAPKGIVLLAIEVPRVAKINAADAKKHPALTGEDISWSSIAFKRSYGFQYAVSHWRFIAAVTMIPHVAHKVCPMGRENSCPWVCALRRRAYLVMSGTVTRSAELVPITALNWAMTAQAKVDPLD